MDVVIDLLLVLTLLGTLGVVWFVFRVVQALHAELVKRGVVSELVLIPKKTRETSNPVKKAADHIASRV